MAHQGWDESAEMNQGEPTVSALEFCSGFCRDLRGGRRFGKRTEVLDEEIDFGGRGVSELLDGAHHLCERLSVLVDRRTTSWIEAMKQDVVMHRDHDLGPHSSIGILWPTMESLYERILCGSLPEIVRDSIHVQMLHRRQSRRVIG